VADEGAGAQNAGSSEETAGRLHFGVIKFIQAESVRGPRKGPVEPRTGAKLALQPSAQEPQRQQPLAIGIGSSAGRHLAAHVFRRRFLRHDRLVAAMKRVRTFRTDLNLHHPSIP
jgi:hypothetical protein